MVSAGTASRDRLRAVLYLRLSIARDDASTSIARQRADLTAEAHRRGLVVVGEEVDNGISGGKERARAGKALQMLRDGDADVLMVWKFDRWSRQGIASVARLIETLDASPRSLFLALQDNLTSDQPTWRIIAGVLAEVARMEAENTGMRISSFIRYAKEAGRFAGGRPPVGYRSVPHPGGVGRALEPDPLASELLTVAARRLAGGESLYRVSRWLNTSKLKPPSADSWSAQTLRSVFTRQAVIGRVAVSVPGADASTPARDVLRDADGNPRQVWKPVIPVELWHAARAVLVDHQSNSTPRVIQGEAPSERRLLVGLLVCAYCGRRMYVSISGGMASYVCSSRSRGMVCAAADGGTAGPAVVARNVEAWVRSTFLNALRDVALAHPLITLAPPPELAETRESLIAIAKRFACPTLDDDEVDQLIRQQRALRRRLHDLEAHPPPPARIMQVPPGETFGSVWNEATQNPQRRRELLAQAIDHITVRRGHPGGTRFDPTRFQIFWDDSVVEHIAPPPQNMSSGREALRVSSLPRSDPPATARARAPHLIRSIGPDPLVAHLGALLGQHHTLDAARRRNLMIELRSQGVEATLIATIVGESVRTVIAEVRTVPVALSGGSSGPRRRSPRGISNRSRDRSAIIGTLSGKERRMPVPAIETPVTPRERVLLRDIVREALRNAIMDGTLQPGELLKDDAVSEWLGVSRTPIREAINELERAGLIEMEPNRYTRVANRPSREAAVAALNSLGVLYLGAVNIGLPKLSQTQRADLADEIRAARALLDADEPGTFQDALVAAFNHLAEQANNPALIKLLQDTVDGLSYKIKVGRIFADTDHQTLRAALDDYARAVRASDMRAARSAAERIFQMPQ